LKNRVWKRKLHKSIFSRSVVETMSIINIQSTRSKSLQKKNRKNPLIKKHFSNMNLKKSKLHLK
jgi:hypothetical protein